MKKKLIFLTIIIIILLGCTAVSLAVIFGSSSGAPATAQITQDGVVISEIDLFGVSEPYSFVITCADGENHVEVRNGEIRIASATCPDGVCVQNGWSGGGSLPIVCLPHKLVITFVKTAASVDGMSR